ncbi:hypothetical protein MRB53_038909 [Persea americana]|nr:hypothetical protein MRB53_038909 [Persea americana]
MGAIRRSRVKTKRLSRGIDQIKADLASEKHLSQYQSTKAAEDLPGLGEFYCIECAKWFESEQNLAGHRKGQAHKRRLKELKEEAHSQEVADKVVGLGREARQSEGQGEVGMVEG